MPAWVSTYWHSTIKWLGLAEDSQRPNTGAFIFILAMLFMATKFTPDPNLDFFQNAEAMLRAVGEMIPKMDNLIGIVGGYIGLKMMQPAQPPA